MFLVLEYIVSIIVSIFVKRLFEGKLPFENHSLDVSVLLFYGYSSIYVCLSVGFDTGGVKSAALFITPHEETQ